ncbi:MAG: 3-phosphoserine/phosphohydroxythreonine transaminase [Fimbriimonadaceae bacterium]|nr:3-phosphoserine/phosphohydroxythreonine transaminase [Fimbriimonadaceae bacterium]QYK55981.1 MAG: 3-phosphoserine/phosphohydroxythreonine transaminase [Fimbriimonadaceae bacterium]
MALTQTRTYNFSAGPGVMPVPVLERAKEEMLDWRGSGMSVMEMSHRGKNFLKIAEESESAVRRLMGVPDNYKVLFLQGGASLQFTMLAMNFLRGGKADYIVTGSWGEKAIAAANLEGEARLLWSGKEGKYTSAPDLGSLDISADARFLHTTLNETIQGVDYLADPTVAKDVVCDMSSCIASRPFDVSRYAMVYAGAQKNLGPSGVCLVLLREDMLELVPAGLPPMLDYKVQVENDWMYNTPPCWGAYMIGLVCEHWLEFGGLEAVGKHNEAKAKVIYDAIDGSGGFYKPHAVEKNRSRMNIPFVLPSDELTDKFLKEAQANNMVELKGHRSVGGCRASVYNAFPLEGCRDLASFMGDFAAKNG